MNGAYGNVSFENGTVVNMGVTNGASTSSLVRSVRLTVLVILRFPTLQSLRQLTRRLLNKKLLLLRIL